MNERTVIMKQTLLLILALVGCVMAVSAQEEGQYRHYVVNPFYVNPAAAGFGDKHNISLNYQNQWAAFERAPRQFTAAYNGPVNARIGLGFSVISDRLAFQNRTEIKGSYAFKLKLAETDLAIGLSTSYEERVLDAEALTNPFVDVADPILLEGVSGVEQFEAAVGVHGKTDNITFGLVLPDLVNASLNKNKELEELQADPKFAFLAYGGYLLDLPEYNFSVEPSLMLRQLAYSSFEVDVNVKANFFEDQLLGGLTYTLGSGGRLSILLGSQFENFGLYYAYGTSFQQFQRYSNGAHELSVSFLFGNNKKQEDLEVAPAGAY